MVKTLNRRGKAVRLTIGLNKQHVEMEAEDLEIEVIYGKQEKTHPDGGYGWLVVFCGFSVQFITVGMQNSAGTILPALISEYNKSEGESGKSFFETSNLQEI